MKIMMKKVLDRPGRYVMVPHGNMSEMMLHDKLKNNTIYSVEVKKARNPGHHNLIFAIAQIVSEHAPHGSPWEGKDAYSFIKAVEMEAGLVDYIMKLDGTMHMVPKSIAFENMDEIEFEKISDITFKVASRILKVPEEWIRKHYDEVLVHGLDKEEM